MAGREGRDERADGEQERVVPGNDDARDAEGLLEDAGPARKEPKSGRTAFGPHPAVQVPSRMADRLEGGKDLEQPGFVPRPMAEVTSDGVRDLVDMGFEHRFETRQPFAPACRRGHRVPGEGPALGFESWPGVGFQGRAVGDLAIQVSCQKSYASIGNNEIKSIRMRRYPAHSNARFNRLLE